MRNLSVDWLLFAELHRAVLSLISCFAGGVFLAACLLDIIPDYLSDMKAELAARSVTVRLSNSSRVNMHTDNL